MAKRKQPTARYRVICYELIESHKNLITDSTHDGFIAATGSLVGGVIDGELSHAEPYELQAHLALLIADDDQLLGEHQTRRRPKR